MISSSQSYNPPRSRLSVYPEDEAEPMSRMSSRHSTIGFGGSMMYSSSSHRPACPSISIYSEEEMPPISRMSSRHSAILDISRPGDDSVSRFGLDDPDRTRTNSVASLDTEKQEAAIASSPISGSVEASSPDGSQPPTLPPFQARFWSKDPVTSGKRKTYISMISIVTLLLILSIFGILSIYWASLYNVPNYAHKLECWIIDFDGGAIGQTVIQAFQNNTGQPKQLTWRVVDASQFPNFPQDVEDAVVNDKTWAAISINPGASDNLNDAINNADDTYNGALAVTAYVNEGRNNNGYASIIHPQIITVLADAVQVFALQNSQQVSANSDVDVNTLLSQAPGVLTNPMSYTIDNLRPFDVPVAVAVQLVGLIYVLIISFIVCMMNYQARVVITGLNQHLRLISLLHLRVIVPFVLYFFISLFFALLSLAFQAPFDRFYGNRGFVIYWMMNWAGMLSLGLALESMITILTPAFIPCVANVSVASVPIEVLPGIFKYGYATPFFNFSQTVRTILFGTKDQLGLNFGVQFAWIGISILTMTLFTILMRKKEERAWVRQQQNCTNNTNPEKA
ncbi:hypothetical protein A7U60_g6029 [Sanghuangporus baumii]|uniref:DUF3533 domain-containing protein n=1 Tax=Sanghuangporus baumii TaxID=108892 RepID=A0A9Q5HVT9_SANBA|nr:hypothetical protein A7U60_g6029 [Sanghuangporus baumii]